MNWATIGHISDILGIVGFILSVISLIFSWSILSKVKRQKDQYKQERQSLFESLCAMRENIWNDKLTDIRIRDKLQTELHGYRMRYWMIVSPVCWYHLQRCIKLLSKDDFNKDSKTIRNDLNFLIARLTKKE